MTDDKPRFTLRLDLSRLTSHVDTPPTLIPDKLLDEAWHTMNACLMDIADEMQLELDDEDFRMLFVEMSYRLILREMFTLHYLPIWEADWKERLGTRKTGVRVNKKGSYDDGSWH